MDAAWAAVRDAAWESEAAWVAARWAADADAEREAARDAARDEKWGDI